VKAEKEKWSVSSGSGFTAKNDFHGFGVIAGRKDRIHLREDLGGQIDIVRRAGLLIVKMSVRLQIWAITGRTPFKVNRSNQIALNQRFETVVDRGKRDAWKFGFYPEENFVGRGMIAFGEEDTINDFALGGRSQTAIGEPLCEGFWNRWGDGGHSLDKLKKLEWF
jgi:hypothetical protein